MVEAETVFDIETDGLLDKLTKIHVLSYQTEAMDEPRSIFDHDEMRDFFLEYSLDHTLALAGHNIVRFDVPAVEKVLGIKIRAKLVDTLGLSWYLHHQRQKHGLAVYGEEYGVPKPKVDDWEGLSKEEYAHRCEEDVKINVRLWRDLKRKLEKLYEQ
jgi:DNA polymerase III alpha subunit (gram-positive type)